MLSCLSRHDEACAALSWDAVRRGLGVVAGEGLNIGWVAVDRHARGAGYALLGRISP